MAAEWVSWAGKRVRLRQGCAALYPNLRLAEVYPVDRVEPEGAWIAGKGIGDPFLDPDRRFVFAEHFEVAQGE